MRKKLVLAFVSSLLCVSSYSKEDWNLVWSDEFDYQGAPDDTKWSFDTEGNNWDWGNNEEQNYTPKENKNAWVEDGNLVIEARKEQYKWYGDNQTREYTSARLRTLGKGDWTYGKVEVRALLPKGRGMWPAIWMLPSEEKYGAWPKSGELDIMENVGYDPTKIHCNIHTEAYNHSIGTNKGNNVSTSLPSENWHVYSLEWDADKVVFFLDGEVVFRFDNEHKTYKEWPYDQTFHLLLNVAVGGGWGGTEGIDNSVFPQRMLVDYVRVYQMGEVADDVKLKLNTTLAETVCKGGSADLVIDTTGIGKPLETSKMHITVTEKMNGEQHDISNITSKNGKLVAAVAPLSDAEYTTTFSYCEGEENEQVVTKENSIKVVHPVVASVDSVGLQQVEVLVAEDAYEPFEFVLDHDKFQNDARFNNLSFGDHTVYVKDALGCVSDSYNFTVLPESGAYSELVNNASVIVYQSNGELYVVNGVVGASYSLVSANGVVLQSGIMNTDASISISSLPKGCYFLLLGNKSYTFVK